MSVEIRPCHPEELSEYVRVGRYVFANNDAEDGPGERYMQAEWTTCAFVDGTMATTMGAWPFRARLNGATVPVAGVTAVGTLPQYRRTGLLRRVMEDGLRTYREQEQYIAVLWASMGAIYQRFGYGLASNMVTYAFDPRQVPFAEQVATAGTVSLVDREEAFPIIKQLYVEYATPRNLMLHRVPGLWEAGVLNGRKKPLYIAIHRDARGEPRGYIIYQTEEVERVAPEAGPDQRMTVRDFVALDANAYRALWEYICRHDLVATVYWNNAPEDDLAPHLLLEPRNLNKRVFDGTWLRVVDVERALPLRPYGAEGDLVFAIAGDDICPWNEGTYRLSASPQDADVARTTETPELTMPPRALGTLVAGHASASHLARCGLIEAQDERALERADRLFATRYRPYCPDGF